MGSTSSSTGSVGPIGAVRSGATPAARGYSRELREYIEVMPHCILQSCKGAVVEEGWLQRNVADRRSAKLVPVIRVTGDLFQAKIFVLSGAVERHVTHDRSNLRNSDDVRSKIANISLDGPETL